MLRYTDAPGARVHSPRPVVDGARVTLPSRCRLIDRLVEETAGSAGMQRLTLVCAPTGFGKTTTIADWLGDDADGTFPVRWLHCTQRDPVALWDAIAAVLRPMSGAPQAEALEPAARVLQLARGLEQSLTLVIDNYELATAASTDMALAELSSVSPRLTLVVIGRRVTLLDGPLVTATTRVRLIGADDLRLTPAEAVELAESLRIPSSPSLTAALERSDGWPLVVRAALNLGSDVLYNDSADGRVWADGQGAALFDPLANLNAFAMASLEIMGEDAKKIVLAASHIDSLSLTHIRDVLESDDATALATVQQLTEQGYLVPVPGPGAPEYRCHRAMRTAFAEFATGSVAHADRKRLYRGRAVEVAATAPFTAFRLFCAAEDFAAAEAVLAHNFATITDEVDGCLPILRAVPEEALHAHPTLTAALLFEEYSLPGIAPSRLGYLLSLWQSGLQRRLPDGLTTSQGHMHLQLLCEAMVMHRVLGNLEEAKQIMHHLEARLSPASVAATPFSPGAPVPAETSRVALTGSGSAPVFYREIAATALSVGDFGRARRNLKRLKRHSEQKIAAPWHGFPHASTRTVTDAEAGTNWLVAALAELAFADMIDGHVRRAGEILFELDELVAATGAKAPGIAWVGAEVARAHLAQESGDVDLLTVASDRLALVGDRLEPWPLLVIAEAASVRRTRGTELALAHLVSGINDGSRLAPISKSWWHYVVNFEAMLNSSIGNLTRAAELLNADQQDSPPFRLERARLALFSGNDVEALLLAQSVGDPGATKRQRVDRRLITAVAAWGCGRKTEAIAALNAAGELVDKYFLPAMLVSQPFEELREVAVATRDTGGRDIVEAIDDIPEKSRAHRYDRLTEMELRTLVAITEHRNANLAAASLFVTAGTVKKHLASVYRKLGVRDRDAAILRAGRMGLLEHAELPRG